MTITAEIIHEMGDEWLPSIYAAKVRPLRTRSYSLDIAARENQAEIIYTLLGIELKIGRQRFACPDLAAARYMRIFARLGCGEFAVPYDITKISGIADELETSWHRMLLLASAKSSAGNERRVRSQVVKTARLEVESIGPGEKMPEFRQSTRQRGA